MKPLSHLYAQFAAFDWNDVGEWNIPIDDVQGELAINSRKHLAACWIDVVEALPIKAHISRRSAVDLAVGKLIEACETDSYTQNVISANAVREALAQLRSLLEKKNEG